MTPNPSIDEARMEPLDRLLSDYFKAQLNDPWPPAHALNSTPSTILPERMELAEAPRTHQRARDYNARARYTLAVSVVFLVGTCWYLSTGFQSGNRTAPGQPAPGGMLGGAGASKPAAVEELKKDAAIKGETVPPRPPMRLP